MPPSDREYTSITATCQLDSSFHAIQKHNSTDGDSIFEISVTVAANDTCVLAFECPFSFTAVSVDLSCDADNTVADLEEPELPMSCQKMPFVPCGHVDIEQIDQSNYPDVNLSSIDFGSCSDVGNGSSCVLECGAGYTRQPSCNCSSGSATGQNLTCLPDCTIQTLPPFATCPEQNLDRDLPPIVNRPPPADGAEGRVAVRRPLRPLGRRHQALGAEGRSRGADLGSAGHRQARRGGEARPRSRQRENPLPAWRISQSRAAPARGRRGGRAPPGCPRRGGHTRSVP